MAAISTRTLLIGAFALLMPATALAIVPATERTVMMLSSVMIVGTVVDVGPVVQGLRPETPYGVLSIRVDEMVGGSSQILAPGKVIWVEVPVMNEAYRDNNSDFSKPLAARAEFYYGAIHFLFLGQTLSQDELREALLGKQLFVGLPESYNARGHLLGRMWPLSDSAWIKSCWSKQPCSQAAPR